MPDTNRFVLPETRAMAVLGCVDLLATIYLLATHRAQEANPLFTAILQRYGVWGFVTFKALLLGGPLALAEWARSRRPQFVVSALRVGIALYILLLLRAYLPALAALVSA